MKTPLWAESMKVRVSPLVQFRSTASLAEMSNDTYCCHSYNEKKKKTLEKDKEKKDRIIQIISKGLSQ